MRLSQVLLITLWLGGCAASQVSRATPPLPEAVTAETVSAPSAEGGGNLQQRVAELETRLALLEAESRRLRSASRDAAASYETVRITAPTPIAEPDVVDDEPEPTSKTRERVPVLRLYGETRGQDVAPPVVNERLPVVPLPEQRAQDDIVTLGYRDALRALREQRYVDAIAGFDAFARTYPAHALAGSAVYWSGEAHYANRDYAKAREAFDRVLAKFAQSDKVPDALVKLGLSLRRLGDEAQAQICFRRVREKYPNTQAAEIALREGST